MHARQARGKLFQKKLTISNKAERLVRSPVHQFDDGVRVGESTHRVRTEAGSRLPVATECRVVATIRATPTPGMRARMASCARTVS